MKRFIIITFFLLTTFLSEGKKVNVMLHLNKVLQVDTLGQNILDIFPSLLYPFIMDGQVKLWDGPQHKIQIGPDALKNLEQGSNTKFSNTQDMFLYEIWNISSVAIQTNTLGIAFTNRNYDGQEVSYGYADFNDLVKVFGKARVPVNINGSSSLTYYQLFAFKRYDFNIVQYDGKSMKSLDESFKIKKQILPGKNYNPDTPEIIQTKIVEYKIAKSVYPVGIREENSFEILKTMGSYLSQQMEEFLNMGGDQFSGGKLNYVVNVSEIRLTEEWKRENGVIKTMPISIQVFINNRPMKKLSYDRVSEWNIYINLIGLDDMIQEKNFSYSISQINANEIPEEKSEIYLKGLFEYDWSKLTEYVKYF